MAQVVHRRYLPMVRLCQRSGTSAPWDRFITPDSLTQAGTQTGGEPGLNSRKLAPKKASAEAASAESASFVS